LTLEEVPAGATVFIDTGIFVHHFTAMSPQCRAFLERCERREVKGVTSVLVLAELCHVLMLTEAVDRGFIPRGAPARKLAGHPARVKQLSSYEKQVERVPLMGIEVAAAELRDLLVASSEVRRRHGLLTNDSLVAAAALALGGRLASADRDFASVDGLSLFAPSDL
jgi:predicted nucleic acid-binding protein